jgi:hypothetical protein
VNDKIWLPGQADALRRLLSALGIEQDEDRPEWQADFDESRGRMLTEPVWVNRAMRRAQRRKKRAGYTRRGERG